MDTTTTTDISFAIITDTPSHMADPSTGVNRPMGCEGSWVPETETLGEYSAPMRLRAALWQTRCQY